MISINSLVAVMLSQLLKPEAVLSRPRGVCCRVIASRPIYRKPVAMDQNCLTLKYCQA